MKGFCLAQKASPPSALEGLTLTSDGADGIEENDVVLALPTGVDLTVDDGDGTGLDGVAGDRWAVGAAVRAAVLLPHAVTAAATAAVNAA